MEGFDRSGGVWVWREEEKEKERNKVAFLFLHSLNQSHKHSHPLNPYSPSPLLFFSIPYIHSFHTYTLNFHPHICSSLSLFKYSLFSKIRIIISVYSERSWDAFEVCTISSAHISHPIPLFPPYSSFFPIHHILLRLPSKQSINRNRNHE